MRVLFVDDDQSLCTWATGALGRRGIDVVPITSAAEALERIQRDDFDVVVSDIHLPQLNGVELCERIVVNRPDVPVIVTHLAASRRNQLQRAIQLEALLPWAAHQGPGILMGDFNSRPDAAEFAPVTTRYRDSWLEASQRGLNKGVLSGSTRPSYESRIDYVLYMPDAPLVLESVEVINTASSPGAVEVSDHRPVLATFRRRAVR